MNLDQPIRRRFSQVAMTRDRDEYILTCPSCHKAKHFYLNAVSGRGYCQRCGFKIRNKYELFKLLGIKNFRNKHTIISRLRELGGVKKKEKKIEYPPDISFDFHSKSGARALKYLNGRGITEKEIKEHKMGFCTSGFYRRRIILPVFEGKELAFWQARSYIGKEPSYLNAPGSSKSEFVFNLDGASELGEAIITEGIFDALRVGRRGVAIFGKFLSERQLALIDGKGLIELTVMLDGDAISGGVRLAQRLESALFDTDVYVCFLPPAKDPGNLSREEIEGWLDVRMRVAEVAGYVMKLLEA